MHFIRCFIAACVVLAGAGPEALAEPLRGAGSTFAAPVILAWSKLYTQARADGGDFTSGDWRVDYEPVGSLAGLMRLDQPEMDFAATDAPLPPAELNRRDLSQFPVVVGGIVVAVNLDGVAPGQLRLSGPVMADIFAGRITRWNEPAIVTLNPGAPMPDAPIHVIHRKDGSGTTAAFTQYLSAVSPRWKADVGEDVLVKWPVGTGHEGSGGVLRALEAQKGGIAYVEFGQAQRRNLSHALIQNWAGHFIRPEPAAFQAAAEGAGWTAKTHFFAQLTDQASPAAYPITAATYILTPRTRLSQARERRVVDLFRLALDSGAREASALGYVPLPAATAEQVKTYWRSMFHHGH